MFTELTLRIEHMRGGSREPPLSVYLLLHISFYVVLMTPRHTLFVHRSAMAQYKCSIPSLTDPTSEV